MAKAAGFFFWLAMAYFLFRGDRADAAWLGLLALAGASVLGLALYLRSLPPRRRPPEEAPSASDLPDFDFSDVKPKDFE